MKLLQSIQFFFKNLFNHKSRSQVRYGDKVGNVTIATQSQLEKHTIYKIGESYRVGECTITLRASKAEVQQVIAYWDSIRAQKEERLKARAIELMLMSPEALQELKIGEWLSKHQDKASVIQSIVDWATKQLPLSKDVQDQIPQAILAKIKLMAGRYVPPEEGPSNLISVTLPSIVMATPMRATTGTAVGTTQGQEVEKVHV